MNRKRFRTSLYVSDEENATAGGGSRKRRIVKAGQREAAKAQLAAAKKRAGLLVKDEDKSGDEADLEILEDSPVATPETAMRKRIDSTKDCVFPQPTLTICLCVAEMQTYSNNILHADGPKMIDLEKVGEVLEDDAVDGVLRQCEDISDKLRKALGGEQAGG